MVGVKFQPVQWLGLGTLSLIKQYEIIKECYQKASHYINLASNSLSIFKDCNERNILENLTSFSLSRDF